MFMSTGEPVTVFHDYTMATFLLPLIHFSAGEKVGFNLSRKLKRGK